MKKFLAGLLALVPVLALSQVVVGSGGNRPTPVDPEYTMPPNKIQIKPEAIRKPRTSASGLRVQLACVGSNSYCDSLNQAPSTNLDSGGNNSGSFRVTCSFSHASFDDPIVWPGQSGKTHLHQFFGNTTTDAQTNPNNFGTIGRSTCAGGIMNRSAYWTPTLVNHCTPQMLAMGLACTASLNGVPIFSDLNSFYYKCDDFGWNCDNEQWAPENFRMITGNASNTNNAYIPGSIECWTYNPNIGLGGPTGGTDNFPNYRFDHIPTKAQAAAVAGSSPIPEFRNQQCDMLNFIIHFPVCWNNVDLYAPPDVYGRPQHMKEGTPYVGCDDPAYPILFPIITLNMQFRVNPNNLDFIRLSSDQPRHSATGTCAVAAKNYCAGVSMHADWWNGWSQRTDIPGFAGSKGFEIIMRECHNKGRARVGGQGTHSDCHVNILGRADPSKPTEWWWMY